MVSIKELRKKIELIDAEIIKMLARRQSLSKNIGKLKAKNALKIKDTNRETELKQLHASLSEKYHLDNTCIQQLFKIIINESKKIQGGF